MKKSILNKTQKKTFRYSIDEGLYTLIVDITYNDECGNNHNSFHITGSFYEGSIANERNIISCGSIHETIKKYAPELAHLIKWHGFTSEGPLYYVENTTYHARTTDPEDKNPGDPIKWGERLAFKGIPFSFEEEETGFFDYVKNMKSFDDETIVEIQYDGANNHQFSPKYTLSGFDTNKGRWYKALFDSRLEGEEMLVALRDYSPYFVKVPIKWAVAVEPDIKAARNCAIWPDATLEQLQNRKLLEARLPKLIEEFIAMVEEIGFTF